MKKDRSHLRELEQKVLKGCVEKRWKEAVDAARAILKEEPENLLALSNRSYALWFLEQGLEKGSDERAAIKKERLEGSRKVIELTEEEAHGPCIGVYTTQGQNVILSLKSAYNNLAWDMVEEGRTREDLEKGLEYIDKAIEVPDHKVEPGYIDTKVRLLLKLGRDDEAYHLAHGIVVRDPHFEDIKDITESDGYGDWLDRKRVSLTFDEALELLGPVEKALERFIVPISGRDSPLSKGEMEEGAVPAKGIGGTVGKVVGPELAAYDGSVAAYGLEGTCVHYTELRHPDAPSFSDMLTTQDGLWVGRFRGFFSATSIIGTAAEETWAASWAPTSIGTSLVYYTHQDDEGLFYHSPSIALFLYKELQHDEGELSKRRIYGDDSFRFDSAKAAFDLRFGVECDSITIDERLDTPLDPLYLTARSGWLVNLFMGLGSRQDMLRGMPSIEVWNREKALAGQWPHLSAYWLLHHMVLDDREELREALALSEGLAHPAVVEVREAASRALDGRDPGVDWWDQGRIMGFREDVHDLRGPSPFGEGGLKRIEEALAAQGPPPEVEKALQELNMFAATCDDITPEIERAQWALRDLELLERVNTMGRNEFMQASGDVDFHDVLDNLSHYISQDKDIADKWRVVLTYKLRSSLRYEEGHRKATPGLIQAVGWLSPSFKGFMDVLTGLASGLSTAPARGQGPDGIGPDLEVLMGLGRRTELQKVAGHFYHKDKERAAFDHLLDGARAWSGQINEWQRDEPDYAFAALMELEAPEVHPYIAKVLETSDCTGKNWGTTIAIAIYAGERKVERAVPGLRRVVEKELGRIDDGDRGRVIQALFDVEGDGCRDLLTGIYDRYISRWDAEERDDPWLFHYYHNPACMVMRAMLQFKDPDKAWLEKAHEILRGYAGLEKLPKDTWFASVALMYGIMKGGHGGFKDEAGALAEAILGQDLGEWRVVFERDIGMILDGMS